MPVLIEGLLGLDAALPVRAGTWETLPPPPSMMDPETEEDAATEDSAGSRPMHAWDGDELVVIDRRTVEAFDPATSSWRTLLLGADDTWQDLPTPPTPQPFLAGAPDGGLVAAGPPALYPDVFAPPVRLWGLPPAGDAWVPLPDTPRQLAFAQPLPIGAWLLV